MLFLENADLCCMINLFMSKTEKKHRKLSPFAKIMIGVLTVCAIACLCISGYYGLQLFRRTDEAEYTKEDKENKAEGESKITDQTEGNPVILKKTADAGKEYIDETLFLGDSNTVRFMTFLDEDGTSFTSSQNTIAVVGIGTDGITTVPCEETSWGTYTMDGAVALLQPRRIIMTFGTNNLDVYNMTADQFIESYELQIKAVENAYPYADLIINSIPPCAELTIYPIISIEQIKEFNGRILKMCEKNGWKYLNSFEALSDLPTGFGKPGYFEADGIHLTDEGLKALFRYIRTHALITEDSRPQPLDPVPYIYGPITEIYTVDPLSGQEFDESVLHPEAQQTETVIPEETYVPQETAVPQPVPEETAAPEPEPEQTAAPEPAPETPAGDTTGEQPEIPVDETPAENP